MTRSRMRLGAVVTAGVLTLSLGACAGDDTDGEATDTSTVATDDVGEEAADDTASGDDAAGEEVPVADFMAMLQEPGEEMLSSYTMTMTMEADGQPMEVNGAMDLSSGKPAMDLTMGVPEIGEMQLIIVDGSVYMSMPGLVPEGKFLKAPPELTADLKDLEQIDVSRMWGTWEEGAQQVVFLGESDVDGTQMRQYEVTVDEEVVDQALQTAAAELGDDAATTSAAPTGPVVYQVWLDDNNLIRLLTMDIDGSPMEMTMDNWGEPQNITAPAEADIQAPAETEVQTEEAEGGAATQEARNASMTVAQQNAVRSAESYLSFTAFSRTGLIEQLEYEGYSKGDATAAVDSLDVDYNEQAAKAAQSYLEFSGFSRSGLIDQLMYEGYTEEQATYGVDQTGL